MIHYGFNFCAAVEQAQDVEENMIQATEKVAEGMQTDLLLKTRDSLRELAYKLEGIAELREEQNG